MDEQALAALAGQLGRHLLAKGLKIVTAESCTGGWIAKAITDIPGCSAWFERGFVSYCGQAKQQMLGVPASVLHGHGAVSAQTARAMAEGALMHSGGDCAVAVTGLAGPGGGDDGQPVGTVFIAWQLRGRQAVAQKSLLAGDRQRVRLQAVATALQGGLVHF